MIELFLIVLIILMFTNYRLYKSVTIKREYMNFLWMWFIIGLIALVIVFEIFILVICWMV